MNKNDIVLENSDSGKKINEKREKFFKYVSICERAEKLDLILFDRQSLIMDIESADNTFNLKLDEWLNADDINFVHDLVGIRSNINRSIYPMVDFGCFVPRFAEKE